MIQVEENREWIKKYFNKEQIQKMNEVSQSAYSDEAAKKLAEWGRGWSEQDQREADRKWNELYTEAQRLADAGSDPAGPQSQVLAERWMGLVGEFTHSDPQVEAGLRKFWQQMGELPEQDARSRNGWTPNRRPFWMKLWLYTSSARAGRRLHLDNKKNSGGRLYQTAGVLCIDGVCRTFICPL
jgi:hypothetical protein